MGVFSILFEGKLIKLTNAKTLQGAARIGFRYWVRTDKGNSEDESIREFLNECTEHLNENNDGEHKYNLEETIEWASWHFTDSLIHLLEDRVQVSSSDSEIGTKAIQRMLTRICIIEA